MMTEKQQTNIENYTSKELEAILQELSIEQIRFVVARQEFATDKEAAGYIGIKPETVYRWGPEVKKAVKLMALDGIILARHIRRKSLAKAMLVKVAGLDLDEDNIRQRVASEIIEWEMGKATQRQELTGADGADLIPARATTALEKVYGDES